MRLTRPPLPAELASATPDPPAAGHGRRRSARVRPGRPRRRRSLPLYVLGQGLVLWLWVGAWLPIVALPPPRAALLVTCLIGALVWAYLLRPWLAADRRALATLRLRGLGAAAPALCAAVPVWVVFHLCLAVAYAHWAGPPPPAWERLEEYARLPLAWIPLGLVGLGFAPLSEEIIFRGLVQRRLERRLGAPAGILLAAVLFAVFHLETWRFGYLVAGGLVFGAFVHAARSLWAGVILHVSANASGLLADALGVPVGGGALLRANSTAVVLVHVLLGVSLALLLALLLRVRSSARPGPHRARRRPAGRLLYRVPHRSVRWSHPRR